MELIALNATCEYYVQLDKHITYINDYEIRNYQ